MPKGKKATAKPKARPAAAKPQKAERRVPVDAIKHKDTRVNIPTNELRKFVKKAEDQYPVTLYPRNPELDPQLVWKGKDQQDSHPLEVPAVPIYIQEKIRPQSIIENLKKQTKERKTDVNLELFSDFNGIESFEDKIDFYNHEGHWTNRMILGDSLLVMNSLAEKEGMKGGVQCIFMDPPYGIKFGSNWQVSTKNKDLNDGRASDVVHEPEQMRAFRDTWKLGIHSYLSYLRDRFSVSNSLLNESGSIFVQIGPENVQLVRSVLDEVFGSKNFVSMIWFRKKTMPLGAKHLERMGDYILWYAKDIEALKFRRLYVAKDYSEDWHWNLIELPTGERRKISKVEIEEGRIPKGRRFRMVSLWPASFNENAVFPVTFRGKNWLPAEGQCWPSSPENMQRLVDANMLEVEGRYLRLVMYAREEQYAKLNAEWFDTIGARDQNYVVETHPEVVKRCILMSTDPGDLVLDPTCGSGTTAFTAEHWGRRWITTDTSRVALALARTRVMSAKFPYFNLADSVEGATKEAELSGTFSQNGSYSNDVRKGFVYKRIPSIKLETIVNNPDIKPGMTQEEIDAAIQRYAESEYLYDQPLEENKRVRVSGPFTVESLSPHRLLDSLEPGARLNADSALASEVEATDFRGQILGNLAKAGIQNTKKHERLTFDSLDPHAGAWVHAKGRFTDKDGKPKFVAVSIGPKYGTITPQHVQEAAKEAMKGPGHDLLVILGFAFGGYVPDEVKQFGELTILIVRMNPDLMMGDELLKKTGAGNLFTVFGEPDINYATKDGMVTVNIKGVDIYDPTTGEVRSSKPDEIACWFIDTDYNDESFFVRHAYFLGDDEPYEKLKRALKAEIDEAAWSQLYSAKSRPFEKPATGRFAVKVINHYGDEVMKVFEVK